MAKELPYFKFEPSEWENGLIQMCSRESKGLFIDIISIYWQRLGDLPYRYVLQKLCNGNEDALKELSDENILKIDDGNIVIHFLDNQLKEFNLKSKKATDAANARWEKHNENSTLDANAMQTHSESNAIREDKRRLDNNNTSTKVDTSFDFDAYIKAINETFGKNHRVVTPKLRRQMTALLKHGLKKEDIINAMKNCKKSQFHKKENYRHCTPEFFSRIDKVDYWSDVTENKEPKLGI